MAGYFHLEAEKEDKHRVQARRKVEGEKPAVGGRERIRDAMRVSEEKSLRSHTVTRSEPRKGSSRISLLPDNIKNCSGSEA